MKLPSNVKFIDKKLQEAFNKLEESNEKLLHKWLIRAFNDIEENAFCGIQVPKKLIPKEYINKYDVKNLWKYDLPKGWRLLYSIESGEILVVSIIVEWLDHKSYERRFKY